MKERNKKDRIEQEVLEVAYLCVAEEEVGGVPLGLDTPIIIVGNMLPTIFQWI